MNVFIAFIYPVHSHKKLGLNLIPYTSYTKPYEGHICNLCELHKVKVKCI